MAPAADAAAVKDHSGGLNSSDGPTPTMPTPRPPTEAPPASDAIIRFRLSDLDTFMSRDYEPYDIRVSPFVTGLSKGERLRSVPVIRIFGATDQGQRVVAHVHGAFSYVYIDYKGSLDPETLNAYILRLGLSLNHALAMTDKRKRKAGEKPQHVAFILPCKATPIYGYHVGHRPYLKIYVVEPRSKKRMSELLRSGAVMGTKFDVYEDHIPFHLQFMLDANLFGCGWVEVSLESKFRTPLPEEAPTSSLYFGTSSCTGPYGTRVYTAETVPAEQQHDSSTGPPKATYCALELDLPISSILNRRKQQPRDIHHDFVEWLQPDSIESGGKLVKSLKELWDDETRRRNARGEPGPPDVDGSAIHPDEPPREWDSRDERAPFWAAEPALRKKVTQRADASLREFWTKQGHAPAFDTFVGDVAKMDGTQRGFLARLRTSFESTEGLFARTMEQDEASQYEYGAWAVRGIGLDVAREADEKAGVGASKRDGNRDRARSSTVQPMLDVDVNEAVVQATQAALDRIDDEPGSGDGDARGRGEEDEDEGIASDFDDTRTEREESEGFGLEQEWSDEEDDPGIMDGIETADRTELEQPNPNGISVSPEAARARGDLALERNQVGRIPDLASRMEEGERPVKRLRISPEVQRKPVAQSPAPSRPSPTRRRSRSPVAPASDSFAAAAAFAANFRRKGPSPLKSSAASSSSPTKMAAGANPFSSPTKVVTVRHATPASHATGPSAASSDGDDEDEEAGAPLLSMRDEPDSSPPDALRERSSHQMQHSLTDELDPTVLEGITSSFFSEYQPTPTVIEHDAQAAEVDLSANISVPMHIEEGSLAVPAASNSTTATSQFAAGPNRSSGSQTSTSQDAPRRTVKFDIAGEASSAGPSNSGQSSLARPSSIEELQPDFEDSSHPYDTLRASQSSGTSGSSGRTAQASAYPLSRNCFAWAPVPPTTEELISTMERWRQPRVVYKDPHFSNPADVSGGKLDAGRKALRRDYGGRTFIIPDNRIRNTPPFVHGLVPGPLDIEEAEAVAARHGRSQFWKKWEYTPRPPSLRDMEEWLEKHDSEGEARRARQALAASRRGPIEGPTQKNGGFKFTSINGASSGKEPQHMALLSMELHVNTRGKLLPDPEFDEIVALFYCLKTENEGISMNGRVPETHVGVLAVGSSDLSRKIGKTDYVIEVVETEHDLFNRFIDLVRYDWDPEAVAGYEVHRASWGYLLERAQVAYQWSLVHELGRVTEHDTGRHGTAKTDRWGFNQATTLNFTGRHVLPIWRILKADNKMQHNSFEHVAYHVLQQRTPHFSFETLTRWYNSGVPHQMARVFKYWLNRTEMNVEMLDAAEVIEQNCESARVFGVDFRSVRVRGSQFKVESVLFKLSKPESFMMLSPNRVDVGRQNAAECQPLIMEPQSAFYKGPVVVLDFQSLYPSVMIAHNYCYSTCLGRVEPFRGTAKFGTTELEHPPGLLDLLKDHITISPNGMMFVKSRVRKSLVAKMVGELLDTRVMVKASMKAVSDDEALLKLLNARQLALKFLANVTYGYIGATFSGRMPCVEIADAIVQTGRETLEKALRTIESRKDWGAKVVYGDTDSLFIFLAGKSKDDAFRIGHEMADTVTSMNPRPIKLKFEKVYLPCVLQAKKRYVGFKFEKPSDKEPEFEAKGIETIRRDGIVALQKMQETCLKILFRTSDLSLVKSYCQRQWSKILAGKASPQDFILAPKVKLGTYAEGHVPPPGAVVATRAMKLDSRAEPEFGYRVPFLLIQAEPGMKQVDRALAPEEFLTDPRIRIDAHHYIIRKMIPPLERIFNLVGADVKTWYAETPRTKFVIKAKPSDSGPKAIVDEYFVRDRCLVCGGPEGNGMMCNQCKSKPGEVAYVVSSRLRQVENRHKTLHEVCASCSSTRDGEGIECDSFDCPVMWDRAATGQELKEARSLAELF